MEIATRLVTLIGGIFGVIGLVNVLMGLWTWYKGFKNENPTDIDKGINSIILGGVVGAVATAITTAIVAAMNAITF